MKIFAALYVGSYETALKIFTVDRLNKLKEVECQRVPIEIVQDIYYNGKISKETISKMTEVLKNMKQTIDMYQITDYKIYAGPLVEKADNILFVINQIHQKTGMKIEVLSNSEQRFLSYRAVASLPNFDESVSKSAAIIDIGGASLQITLFINGKVRTTQHIGMGTATVRESLRQLSQFINRKEQALQIMNKEINVFINMFVPEDLQIENLIILGDNLTSTVNCLLGKEDNDFIKADKYLNVLKQINADTFDNFGNIPNMIVDNSDMLESLLLFHKALVDNFKPKNIFTQNVSVNEGMAFQYFSSKKQLSVGHDFEQDVLTAAWAIAKRYSSYQPHLKALEYVCSHIFDAMKKYHGLPKRYKLLVRCVAILHDCGKYISIAQAPECSYSIIMSSEILGLTHIEREMIATAVKYASKDIVQYENLANHFTLEEYLAVVQMIAILRVANALDRSHKQKFKDVKMCVKKKELLISVEATDSFVLEKGMFEKSADFFEQVYGIRPVLI